MCDCGAMQDAVSTAYDCVRDVVGSFCAVAASRIEGTAGNLWSTTVLTISWVSGVEKPLPAGPQRRLALRDVVSFFFKIPYSGRVALLCLRAEETSCQKNKCRFSCTSSMYSIYGERDKSTPLAYGPKKHRVARALVSTARETRAGPESPLAGNLFSLWRLERISFMMDLCSLLSIIQLLTRVNVTG